jgi:hypothetical protein
MDYSKSEVPIICFHLQRNCIEYSKKTQRYGVLCSFTLYKNNYSARCGSLCWLGGLPVAVGSFFCHFPAVGSWVFCSNHSLLETRQTRCQHVPEFYATSCSSCRAARNAACCLIVVQYYCSWWMLMMRWKDSQIDKLQLSSIIYHYIYIIYIYICHNAI